MSQTKTIERAFAALGKDADNASLRQWVEQQGIKPTASFDSLVSKVRVRLRSEIGNQDMLAATKAMQDKGTTLERALDLYKEVAEFLANSTLDARAELQRNLIEVFN